MPKRSSVSPERNRNKRRKSLSNDESCTVFVGNLRFETKWQALKDHMRRAGNVDSASILEDRQTRKSKGCGIVTYQDPRDATRAIRELNESMLDGRKLFVQPDKQPPGERTNNYSSGGGVDDCAVYVGNLDWDCTWQNLKDKFKPSGYIDKADIMMAPNGKSKGYGKLVFSHPRDAQNAIRRFDGAKFQGRDLIVKAWGSGGHDRDDDRAGGGGRGAGGGGSHTLYVGNLDFDCRPRDLRNLFSRFGRLINVEIAEAPNGKSKGFGLVDFGNQKDAQKALNQMDSHNFQGRPLKVKWDRDSKPSATSSSSARPMNDDDGLPNTTVFVGNLDFECRWQDLKDVFKKVGQVEHVEIAEHEGKSKGWGTVQFLTSAQAQRAIDQLDGTELQSRKMQVKWDRKKGAPPGSDNEKAERKNKGDAKKERPPKKQKPEPPAPSLDGALSSSR
ncbi:unnamed protein product [Cylindrotheca closterium]|uniref:RRM domain-containing protein n=1 Tax=Cylindrotheca closterium TaxID=2856 RepID=A0AAD2FPN2_9STRA|nr:unnamed protein product [Cylindrotheca closterium]